MIVLVGHGYIGSAVADELDKRNIDFEWVSHTYPRLFNIDCVINCAGFTGSPTVDACETYKQETINGNVVFPLKLEMMYPDTPIIHISSGCIYNGYKTGGWTETDRPNFDFNNGSFYSGSKALEQKLLMPFMDKSYLFRIRMPFRKEDHPKNYLTKLKTYKKLINYENSLTNVDDLVDVIIEFAQNKHPFGIYNVCNKGSLTTNQICDILGIDAKWFTEEEFKNATVAPRSNCTLNVDKLYKIYPIRTLEEAIREI